MNNQLSGLNKKSDEYKNIYQPTLYRLKNSGERKKLEKLLAAQSDIKVFDEILGQVEELVKCKNPKITYSKEQLNKAAIDYIGEMPWEEYGVWVYYPWSSRLVHVLDEEEFVEVRTNRNQYKITQVEKAILATKKIGIIGLSVGQSIAVSMAMERIFGEIRLADFDKLELSNLNRIRTGIHNLETSKTILVAREIVEIDPFLKITCYTEGLTTSNIENFFLLGGRIDVLVDECDSLDIKVLCRQKAKELKVAVIMDTSDRGMIDIERYDLEPDRLIFHGLLEGANLEKLTDLTKEERISLVMKIIGESNISERLNLSMKEIGQTITTWPQLASSVILGSAIGTDICRRILLSKLNVSGRFYVDLEELIKD